MAAPEGNNYSSRTNRLWADTLRRIAIQDPDRLRRIAEKMYDSAEAGEISAQKELGDRLDGKASQALTLSGDSENPLTIIQRVILNTNNPDPTSI